MDPAIERITTVDERAKEQVRKAREYADSVAASRAGECEDAADAEREAVREKIAEAANGDLIAAAIVREITEGAF